MLWSRSPNAPGVPHEDELYERPGDVQSIPRDGRPKNSDSPEFSWRRAGGVEPEDDGVYDWDSNPEPDYDWSNDKPEDVHWKGEEPLYDWSENLRSVPGLAEEEPLNQWDSDDHRPKTLKQPDNFSAVGPDHDWSADKPDDVNWKGEEPTYDWSSDKPTDLSWKKNQPYFDWAGARPEEPFDRPRDALVPSEPQTPLYDEPGHLSNIPDDLSEYSEDDEDLVKPVTGVPCAAWTFLAMGVAAGAAANATGAVPATVTAAPPPQMFMNEEGLETQTDQFFPDPQGLLPCSDDPTCGVVMDALGPNIPPGTMAAFDIPGTCQSKARDWLRTGKDILEFDAERIRQRYAMTVFFCEEDGGEWLENDVWLSDMHECDWYNNIGLDACNRVEQMELFRVNDNGLQGTLPVELSILSNLYEFIASNNLISGTIPPEYASMTQLDTLAIAFNQFEGEAPAFIFEFPDMYYLDIGFNQFEGSIPDTLAETMPKVEILYMENNKFTGTIPDNLGSLNLERLHLDDNMLTGTIPSTLGNPPKLKKLFLHSNNLTGGIPTELANLQFLQAATLHFNDLEGSVDQSICELSYQKKLGMLSVDCENVGCECCVCGEPDI